MPKIYEKDALLLREQVASLDAEDGIGFECVMVNMHTPAIRSKQTGRTAIFSWNELLELAIDEGLEVGE